MYVEKEIVVPPEAFDACASLQERFDAIVPHKYIVGIGFKEKGGDFLNQLSIFVYVCEKKPSNEIPSIERIPTEYGGFMTDVVEFRPFLISDNSYHQTLRGGIQINRISQGVTSHPPGTLGAIVRSRVSGEHLLLTCAHVVKRPGESDAQAIGKEIFQPAQGEPHARIIGTVSNIADVGMPLHLDCAVIKPNCGYLKEIVDIGPVKGVNQWDTEHTLGRKMKKRGTRTLLTEGTMNRFIPGSSPQFVSAFEITTSTPGTAFAGKGDSGSVVLNENDEVEGLLFSIPNEDIATGLSSRGLALPIKNVQEALKIDIAVAPEISVLVPDNALAAVGTFGRVTIEGWGFSPSPQVEFGGLPAIIVSAAPRRVEVIVPASLFSGVVDVIVTNAFGESSLTNSYSKFSYNIG
ncbi:IPT/TIG domain-containing protein [Paenibacillus mendelii]|uniref:IPT/TIG domain-containing protein n=1 Tax=Paenibacillus mendelii TaxID=206163 RepID=A0ABV6J9U1_9BACL|nr:IPT/TIG domain-containing protein [Paenibacillus mendelii]MCQ6563987.1 hypothetical protein [Paenibacillus mendelii]